MKTTKKQKAIKSSLGILIAILLFFSSGIKLPVLDTTTDSYFNKAITKAGLAYATCRALNGAVSIIKDSTIQLEPAGIGLSLALGQALDPVDDMAERLSDVLVVAITSLGVQKLAYEISVSLAPPILAVFLFFLSIFIWLENEKLIFFQKMVTRFLLLILIVRFCLPISSLANEFIYKHFFAVQISEADKALSLSSVELDNLKNISFPKIDGVLGTIKNSSFFLKQKSMELKHALLEISKHSGDIIENLLKLTFLNVGMFLIQVIIFPILIFWFLVKLTNTLFHTGKLPD